MGIGGTPVIATCKPYMDIAMMRRPGSKRNISRWVCVTSIAILRSGVKGNFHAPFWSSGRRSDPPIDCDGTPPADDRLSQTTQTAWERSRNNIRSQQVHDPLQPLL
jgi:hypothetical protein